MLPRKSYGQTVLEHRAKNLVLEDDPREYSREQGKDVWNDVKQVAEESRNLDIYRNKSFYIVICHNVERMGGVPRNRTFSRQSPPTPTFNQSVWKYEAGGGLEFIWSIPNKFRYYEILRNRVKYLMDPHKRDRAKMVILMENGELLKWVKSVNGEKIDAVIKISKEQE